MKRNILILIILFGGVEILIQSCCPKTDLLFTNIIDLEISNTKIEGESIVEIGDSVIVENDNFRIELSTDIELITIKNMVHSPNSLFAFDCDNEGINGLKDKIKSIELSSNYEIFEIVPGESLIRDDRVKIYPKVFFDDSKNERITIEDWKNILNSGMHQQSISNWYIEFQEQIESQEFLKFKLLIEFESNRILEKGTNFVKIE